MHPLHIRAGHQGKGATFGRHAKTRAKRLDPWPGALGMAVMMGQVLRRGIRLANIHHQQREAHAQGGLPQGRLGQCGQHMRAEIGFPQIIRNLGHTEQARHLRQDFLQATTLPQGAQHGGGGWRHQAARQFKPH